MNTVLRRIAIPILLILLLVFSGCAGKSGTIQAITDAIIAYTDYYIEVRNLGAQVKQQAPQVDSQTNASDYVILADIPDYTKIDPAAVGFTPPDPSLSAGSLAIYQKQSAFSLRQALEQYAANNAVSEFVQIPIRFSVVNSKKGWKATLSSQSKLNIQQTVEGLVLQVLEQNESYQADYRAMQFSTIVANLLSDAFGGVEYARLITIKSMAQNDDGSYTVNISYPDPEAVYRMLARAYEDSFNQQFYGDERIAVLSAEGIADIDLSTAIQQNATVVLLYHRETGESSLLNDGGLAAQVASAKAKAEAEATAAINAAWRVEPLEPPPSGSILEGESAGNAIQFKASDKLGTFFYVRFYAISSDDTSEEGTLALGVFIQGGKTAKFKLPSGYYRVSCLVGNSWYGLDHLFGSDSKTYDGGNAVRSRAGYQNNISFE